MVSSGKILNDVWGYSADDAVETIRVHMRHIRTKLDKISDGKKYIDGGVYDNMPVNLLARHGYDKLIVIRTNVASKPPKRMIERDDLDITYIMPNTDLGRPMAFNEAKFDTMRKMGYKDALRLLDNGRILPYNN